MMKDKIKELAKVVRELGKLLDEVATLIAKLTLVVMARVTPAYATSGAGKINRPPLGADIIIP